MRRNEWIERRAAVWDASGGVCHYCGAAMHPVRDFTVDHVVARANGGTDDPGNLKPDADAERGAMV